MGKSIMVNVTLESGEAFLIPWLRDRDKEAEMIQTIIDEDYPEDAMASRELTTS